MQSQQTFLDRAFATYLAVIIVSLALSSAAFGQANQGSIAGTVVDQTGALVTNAKLTAKEQSTATTYSAVSSSAGLYRFPNVNIGTYDVTVGAPGFKTVTLTGVVVQVASTVAL